MRKEIILKVISLLIIIITSSSLTISYAVSNSDLNNINNKIDKTEEELGEVRAGKTEALKNIAQMTENITQYEDKISELNKEIKGLNQAIKEAQGKLDEATEEYDKHQKLLDERLVTLYENGETTYLDVLLSSRNLTDFLSNYFMVSELALADTELLEKIEAKKNEIDQDKRELEESKQKVEGAKKEQQTKANELKAAQTAKKGLVDKLTDEEKQLQKDLDQFEKDKQDIKRELEKLQDKYPAPGNPSSCGYVFPVMGLSKANIRNKSYPSYPGHTGTDVNINVVGKTIVAVKDGVVIKSTAYKNSNGYYSYGECIIIDHQDGTATLYAHGLAGSRKVQNGARVKQGQPIMTVGSTGNSTGPHLHFEVRVKGRPVNPLPYL